jgi:hypothetical protein
VFVELSLAEISDKIVTSVTITKLAVMQSRTGCISGLLGRIFHSI